jgi:hypothetical protein
MVLDAIATLLQTAGYGTIGTDLFYPEMPDQPDDCLALADFPAGAPEMQLGYGRVGLEILRVQVTVRAALYDTGRTRIEGIVTELAKVLNQSVSGVRYLATVPNRTPSSIGRDPNGQYLFTVDFDVMKEPG